jgi:hypothetical protein
MLILMETKFNVKVGSFDPPNRITGAGNQVGVLLPFVGVKSTGGKVPRSDGSQANSTVDSRYDVQFKIFVKF